MNVDWDRIKAVDILVACNSFLPPNGHIKSVVIYYSDFGLEMIEKVCCKLADQDCMND